MRWPSLGPGRPRLRRHQLARAATRSRTIPPDVSLRKATARVREATGIPRSWPAAAGSRPMPITPPARATTSQAGQVRRVGRDHPAGACGLATAGVAWAGARPTMSVRMLMTARGVRRGDALRQVSSWQRGVPPQGRFPGKGRGSSLTTLSGPRAVPGRKGAPVLRAVPGPVGGPDRGVLGLRGVPPPRMLQGRDSVKGRGSWLRGVPGRGVLG